MGMGEAVGLFFKNYANFQGRSRRAEYWWVTLAFFLGFGALGLLMFTIGGGISSYGELDLNPIGMLLAAVLGIAYLAILVPMIALVVRRFHDLNQSGWLYLVFILLSLIPIVGFLASIGLLIWFCQPGTKGPNKYGPDPLGGVDVGAFD